MSPFQIPSAPPGIQLFKLIVGHFWRRKAAVTGRLHITIIALEAVILFG
jgi:hypothetical protein